MGNGKLSWLWPLGGGIAVLVGCVLTAALVSAAVYYDYRRSIDAEVLAGGQVVELRVPEGASWSETRKILGKAGLVEHPVYFDVWARWRDIPKKIRAGRHRLEGPMDHEEMARALQRGGRPENVVVTFPEGYTVFDMADRLAAAEVVAREAFLDAVESDSLLEEVGLEADSFEGYLFPDTYELAPNASARDIVRRLHGRWREAWGDLARKHPGGIRRLEEKFGLERHGIVTLASIVAAETGVGGERSKIARVMLNRLRESMRLQADPTCVYGPNRYKRAPSPKLCRESPNQYSTYVHDGLPPGPIGNPGRESIKAVLDPATGGRASEYLFYCARNDGSGRHVFSETYEAHKRAIKKYLK